MATYEIPTTKGYQTVHAPNKQAAIGQVPGATLNQTAQQSVQSFVKKGNNTIDASRIGNTNTATIPSPITSNTAQVNLATNVDGVIGSLPSVTTPETPVETEAQKSRSSILDRISQAIGLSKEKGTRTADLNEEEGVFAKKKLATDIENEAIAKSRSYDKQIEKIRENRTGMLADAVEQEVAKVERLKNSELADISIRYKVAAGDYTGAVEIVNSKIEAEFEPLENEIQSLTALYGLYADDMTESEKVQANAAIQEKRDAIDYQRQLARDKILQQYDLQTIAYQEGFNNGGTGGNSDIDAYVLAYQSGQIPLTQVPQKIRGQVLSTAQSSGTNRMLELLDQYRGILSGLNFLTANTPNKKAALNSLKGQITAEYKQQKQLGTLDAGVQALIDKIIPDPSKLSVSSLSNKAQVAALDNFIKNQGGNKPTTPTEEDPLGLGI